MRTDTGGEAAVALVTGAAGAMGTAIARRLAAGGVTVAVTDRTGSATLTRLAEELCGLALPADLTDPDAPRRLVAAVRDRIGGPDILVANHAYMSMAPLVDAELEDWWRVVDTNLGGTFALVQAVLPSMRQRGWGKIVAIASEWGVTGWPGATAYAASKAGVISLVKSLGRELAPEGIAVNAVAPGVTNTAQLQVDADGAGVDLDEIRRRYAADIPLGRIGEPDEIAAAVSFLCDRRVGAVVGQTLQVNGGSTRSRV